MSEPPTILVPCARCGHELYQRVLRRALQVCPRCNPSSLPRDPDALRRLARRERQRIKTLVAGRIVHALAVVRAFPRWPPELATTARVLDRWGAFGSGRPAENPDLYGESQPVPLDPDTQVIVTACIGSDPRARQPYVGNVPLRVRTITYDIWWRGAAPSFVGEKNGMKPRTFGRVLDDCLRMHQRAFLASDHADLVALVESQE